MQFAQDLETTARRSAGGEYAWRRSEALRAADALARAGCAILGGELWLVRGQDISGALPQRSGPPAIYHWGSERGSSESWSAFVERSRSESRSAINALPPPGEVDAPPHAEVYYNLTWVSEHEEPRS
jgi:hypothetical protein